jgi:hypothetical protein
MNTIKLICSDIDGTLLNSQKQINDEDKKWIRKAWNEKHIPFALVSGRFRNGVTQLQEELGVDCPLSCFNGAYVEFQGTVLKDEPMDYSLISSLLQQLSHFQNIPIIFSLDQWYMQEDGFWADVQRTMCPSEGNFGSFDEFFQGKAQDKPYKFVLKNRDATVIKETFTWLRAQNNPAIDCFLSTPNLLEIVNKGTHKGSSIDTFAQYFHIDHANIMAFGDYNNDVEMIDKAGYGIAMENAVKEVKDVAFAITDSNDQSGIAQAIKKYIFNR